jgi:UDP:flavonoid glycosyltransferase YjiC (YdhE family)
VEEAFFPYEEVMFEAARDLCRRSDMLVGHLAMYPAKAAAIQMGVPFVATIYWPGFLPSAHRPPVRMPNLGPLLNRLEWKLLQVALDFFLKGRIAQFWKRHNLPRFRHLVPDLWSSDLLNLLAASPQLWPEEADWGQRYRLCGFFNMPEPAEQAELDADLRSFLDEAPAPVYMTLGATGQVDPHRRTRLMISAARAAGCRAVIQTLSPDFPAGSRDGDICFTGRVPHSQVFRRCVAVVHHGGAGTSHTAARVGKPSVVVAFSDEQLSWGRQLHRAGVAVKPTRYRKAKPQCLAEAIQTVSASPRMRRRAEEIGQAMRQEDGAARAVELLEELYRGL